MPTIEKRVAQDGTISFRAKVRLKGQPPQFATFERLTDARRWAAKIETEIRDGRYFPANAAKSHTLKQLIDRYEKEILPNKKPGSQRAQGYQLAWWLVADFRLRGAYVYFRDVHAADGTPLPAPEKDGWDWTVQARVTIDARSHRFGVTWGPFAQLILEPSVPGLDSYNYQVIKARAYYSWRYFEEHELELRTRFQAGRHVPFQEDLTLGGVPDLRGYDVDQFRGDLTWMFRAEYSVPLFKWRSFAFRALGFYDSGFVGRYNADTSGRRDYLATQAPGSAWFRNDVGAGLRIYVSSIVLPLLGLDFGYGIEGHSPEVYFEVGLTDF